MTSPIDIGSRLELFVDDFLIDRMEGAALKLHQPVPREVALETDRPWEGNMCGYVTVLRDIAPTDGAPIYRMYYKSWRGEFICGSDGTADLALPEEVIACAESLDGINWHRPEYGVFEANGNKRNNIVWIGEGGESKGTHGFTPFIDTNPECPPDERYKAVGSGIGGGKHGLWAMISADGVNWRTLGDQMIMHGYPFDSQNLAFYDDVRSEYRAYIRDFVGDNVTGCRGIRTATSQDFVTWTDAEWLEYPGVLEQQMYTNQIMPYPRAPHIFIGFPTRYTERPWSPAVEAMTEPEHRRQRADVSERYGAAVTDGLFMSSRDGKAFRRWDEAFLRPGPHMEGSWTYGDTYQAYGLLETESDQPSAPPELSFYANEGCLRGDSTFFRRYTLRMDGFVSVNAAFSGGEFVTKLLTFSGSRLTLNMSTSGAGSIHVEIQDADSVPIDGYALDDCHEVIGDEIERTVSWMGGSDVSRLAGRSVRMRLVLSDADLYAMQFSD
jgi:hypothetical protein